MLLRFALRSPLLLVTVWGLSVSVGLFGMIQHESTPCGIASAPPNLPVDAKIQSIEGHSNLLVFVHPYCPCSNATISELERIVARTPEHLTTNVIFWHPRNMSQDWHQTSLWKRAKQIPGVHVLDDVDGILTHQYQVKTSGQALLYDTEGRLRFTGGITPARAHSGDNLGCDAILAIANSREQSNQLLCQQCAVFGCPINVSSQNTAQSEGQK